MASVPICINIALVSEAGRCSVGMGRNHHADSMVCLALTQVQAFFQLVLHLVG